MTFRFGIRSRASALVGALLFFSVIATANAASCDPAIGRAVSVQGRVEVRAAASHEWQTLALDQTLCPGDSVRVAQRSRAALLLSNETVLRLDQYTTLTLSEVAAQGSSWLDLLQGVAHFITRVPGALKIKTPFVNAAVEGTEFTVASASEQASISVLEGRVVAENAAGRAVLNAGDSTVTRAGQAPTARTDVRPLDAVQWAIYYPPLLDQRLAQLPNAPAWQPAVARSLAAYSAGDLATAFAAIDTVATPADARFLAHRAALALLVGRVDSANADIARARELDPRQAHALALAAVVAVARNDVERALVLANEAVANDPQSLPAHAALSYARQAAFDIDGAAVAMEQASALDPNDAYVHARVAELQLARGDVSAAQASAQRAAELNPRSARARTVLGFVELARLDVSAAQAAFGQSITLDSSDPLPRLGLGLALIRRGDLVGGREQIEIAAALDPANALVRSYLGKAYYEEKRERLAATQLLLARELDPKDPTPWLYDAVRKQSQNRPVEALRDLEQSIARNDARAVYRSRLLLDQDLAARSAGLARIYGDLGFEQLALSEGFKSLAVDPANHSAHRLLADSYSTRPRHEIARVSELLQAQMLQPLNLAPLQPQAAESHLALQTAGPNSIGLNEYNPLFVREGVAGELRGVTGTNDTRAAEGVVSALYGPVSASVGRFDYHTDGFRTNGDLDHEIDNAFVQATLSPALSLQLETRTKQSEFGDLDYRFDLTDFFANDRYRIDTRLQRVGLRYQVTAAHDVLLSHVKQKEVTRQHQEFTDTDGFFNLIDAESEARGTSNEAQWLGRYQWGNISAGGGRFRQTGASLIAFDVSFGGFPITNDTIPGDLRTDYDTVYTYATVALSPTLSTVVGASAYDYEEAGGLVRDDIDPKLGLIWSPFNGTTVRAAAFRAFKRPLLSNQTLEPTSVAGFNQFFEDANGSRSKRFGLGLDQKFSTSVFSGIELTRRDIERPVTGLPDQAQDEKLHRLYVYWAPADDWSLALEYEYDRFEAAGTETVTDLRTQRLPIRLGYFPHERWRLGLTATAIHQQVAGFVEPATDVFVPYENADRFWLIDAAISYRLPRRYGMLSLVGKNLLDQEFHYRDRGFQTEEILTPEFVPQRTLQLQLELAF